DEQRRIMKDDGRLYVKLVTLALPSGILRASSSWNRRLTDGAYSGDWGLCYTRIGCKRTPRSMG
ncbi:MAG: hypothetical protein ABI882_23730, partial [Acidobacteriota bacterium]